MCLESTESFQNWNYTKGTYIEGHNFDYDTSYNAMFL